MKKKEYIDAIDEIKASKSLKNKTLEKISKKKNNLKTYLPLVASAFIVVATVSMGILPINSNKNKVAPLEVIEQDEGLPKLENFENLYEIVEDKNTKYYEYGAIEESVTDTIKSDNSSGSEQKYLANTEKLDYSKTNVQVEGVDEADIVKTDGNYIYYISSEKIVIVDAKNSNDLKIVSEINYEEDIFYPKELYINDNKLIVIGENSNSSYRKLIEVDSTYSYITKRSTIAKIYNIKDKDNVKLEREIQIKGNYLSSRMIGDNIYLIANEYIYSYLFRDKEISQIDEESLKPMYKDTAVSNEEKSIAYNDIYYFPDSEDTSYLIIAGFNVNNNEEANIKTYLGAGEDIYSSQDNLYITRVKYEYKDSKLFNDYSHDVNTYIYKFKLENSKARYINSGSVPGKVLNQFSMDEKDGYFRIATTDSENWRSETNINNLYVLDENLKIVGKLEGLAKGEKIYSVRFMGNMAYMVTFVETDPLFVIDLSKPEKPTVLGELKIPGYSKYLHPYDETHIIGFGENTKTNKYGGVVTDGMKMALFDVSNPNNPKELYSVDIGDKGTYSEILNNHKALLFSKEKNIIAFPISISEEGERRSKLKFQGAIVYGLDLEKGFTLKGRIEHMKVEDGYKNYESEKEVERIIYIKDSLYTLSRGIIKATNIDTMKEESKIDL